ncbi:restriction endonuclease subunit S [Acinetobacter radioresistens]|uniref:restriction endonuclease subunit S n=1 Tax=Acinetobacter radioresistens TaxID=40216 RepID=UPI003A8019AE
MQFKQYPSYKNSGVEWLGDVPEHWEVKPNKYVFKIQKRIAGTLGFNVLSITQKGLKVKDIESNAGQMAQDYSKYQIVNVGDFAMNHMDLLTGWIDIAKVKGVTSPDYRVFEVRNKKVNKEYFLHLFQLGYRNKILFAFGQGAAQMGRWRLQSETFNTLKMPFPSIEEQEKIVSFLDSETTRIDNLIAKQEKLIELLEEQRKSIISHAVTKGLNPNAPMKDSGVEWLGEVPEHWEVKKIKRISPVNRGASPRPINDLKYFDDNGEYAWVRISDVTRSKGFLFETEQRLSSLGASFSVKLEPESLFLSIAATVGKPCITKIKTCIHDGFVYFPKLNKHRDLLFNIFESKLCFVGLGKLGTQLNLNSETVEDIYVAIPPESEEKAILGYIQTETTRIDNLISKQKSLIEKLKEYRSSIISHAVTGKIDIREFC